MSGVQDRKRAWVLAAAVMAVAPAASAAEAGAGGTGFEIAQAETGASVNFDIPAQPLAEALNDFAAATGWEVGAPADLTAGVTSPGVSGTYAPAGALTELLAGTGLQFRLLGRDAAVLERAAAGEQEGPMRMGPVTVTASRVERSVATIPGSVTVIDAEEMDEQRQLTRDIQAILQQTVPGFSGATGDRGEGFNALRGRTALILQNGVPQTVQLRTSGLGINNIDPRQIERIEVARTANATLGFGGAGGTINLITKRPNSPVPLYTFEVGTSFQPHAVRGDNLTKEGYVSVEGREGDFDYLFSASARDIGTGFDAKGDRIPDGFTEFKSEEYGFANSLGWQLDDQRSLRFDVNYRRLQEDDDRTEPANAVVGVKKAEAAPNTADFFNPFFDPLKAWNLNLVFDDGDVLGSAVNVQTFFQR